MRIISKFKPNTFLNAGILFVVLNAIFLDFNFYINIFGLALILFSEDVTKLINNLLKK